MSHSTAEYLGGDPSFEEIDRAIREDDAARSAELERSRSEERQTLGKLFSLTRLLRYLGATVLIASAFTFMVQNWGSGSDVLRYLHFLGFTAVLAAAGFFSGLRVHDDKGARTFLGLAAAIVPAHFTVLGALLYSQFPWLSGFVDYPAYAHITAPDAIWAVLTTAIGAAVLTPIVWLAFLAFARPEARRLTAAYLMANAMLLIPTRHPDAIGLMALVALAACAVFDRKVLHPVPAMRTREGRFTRIMLVTPLAVLIGRSINLYELSSLFGAGLFATLAVLLFEFIPQNLNRFDAKVLSQRLSVVPAAGAWWLIADTLRGSLHVPVSAMLPLLCLPLAITLVLMSLRAVGPDRHYRTLAALVATCGTALNLIMHPDLGPGITCLAVAIVTTAYGFTVEQRGVFFAGIASVVFALLYQLHFALELYSASPWGSLAVLGIITLIAASLVERHHKALLARAVAFKTRIGSWNA